MTNEEIEKCICQAKCVDTGEWKVGYYVWISDDKNDEYRIYTGYAKKESNEWFPDFYVVDPKTVGRFTGKRDKEGIGIFEGDILLLDDYDKPVTVYWSDRDCRFYVDDNTDDFLAMDFQDVSHCAIIGNIYD